MKPRGFSRFEALAQDLVEGKIGRLFGGRLEPFDLASRLARVMEDSINSDSGLSIYSISLNHFDYKILTTTNPNLAAEISEMAWKIGNNNVDGRFEKPVIRIMADPDIRRHNVQVKAETSSDSQSGGENTKILSHNENSSAQYAGLLGLDAFLIIHGRRHVPLKQPVITIGRQIQNDIVLDMPTVSRRHAQIRWRYGRFVLYDVSTRGKTKVNGHPVREHVLKSGDVISLSNALLIYGEGHEEPAVSSSASDTKTLIRPSKAQ